MATGPLLHADADAFFVSVALRSRPDLVGHPVAVTAHVIVACASYQARALGVRGGMLIAEARRLCPELIELEVPYAEVEEVGDALFDLFHSFTAAVEPGSMEEAFLDIAAPDWNTAIEAAGQLRTRAARELRIPITVGVGRTKLMAKLASRAGKPQGLHVIRPEDEEELRNTLQLAQVWGIGATTLRRLRILKVERLTDLDAVSDAELQQVCGSFMAGRLRGIRNGTDDATVRAIKRRTSLRSEGTTAGYARPDWTPEQLLEICLQRVCHRAQQVGLVGAKVSVTLKPDSGSSPLTFHLNEAVPNAAPDFWFPLLREMLPLHAAGRLSGLCVTLGGLIPTGHVQEALF